MTWDQFAGSMTEMRGRIREWWGRRTHNDETVINGRKQQLIGLMQKRYGDKVEEIEHQIGSFERHVARHADNTPRRATLIRRASCFAGQWDS